MPNEPGFVVGDVVEDTRFPNHAGQLPLGAVLRVDASRREADVHFAGDPFGSIGVHWSYLRAAPRERADAYWRSQRAAPLTTTETKRDAVLDLARDGHSRAPEALASIFAGWDLFLQYAVEDANLPQDEADKIALRLSCVHCSEVYHWTEEFNATVHNPEEVGPGPQHLTVTSECPFCGKENEHTLRVEVTLG